MDNQQQTVTFLAKDANGDKKTVTFTKTPREGVYKDNAANRRLGRAGQIKPPRILSEKLREFSNTKYGAARFTTSLSCVKLKFLLSQFKQYKLRFKLKG